MPHAAQVTRRVSKPQWTLTSPNEWWWGHVLILYMSSVQRRSRSRMGCTEPGGAQLAQQGAGRNRDGLTSKLPSLVYLSDLPGPPCLLRAPPAPPGPPGRGEGGVAVPCKHPAASCIMRHRCHGLMPAGPAQGGSSPTGREDGRALPGLWEKVLELVAGLSKVQHPSGRELKGLAPLACACKRRRPHQVYLQITRSPR